MDVYGRESFVHEQKQLIFPCHVRFSGAFQASKPPSSPGWFSGDGWTPQAAANHWCLRACRPEQKHGCAGIVSFSKGPQLHFFWRFRLPYGRVASPCNHNPQMFWLVLLENCIFQWNFDPSTHVNYPTAQALIRKSFFLSSQHFL